jgi:two-component system, cell cycle response regulator DivK
MAPGYSALAARSVPPLILLVEDHADTREMYALGLTIAGYHVAEAESVALALHLVAQTKPDMVVTDLVMAGSDGFSFCRTLRTVAATANLPVIALTAVADTATLTRALQAGFDAVLVKPCMPDALREEICRMLAFPRAAQCDQPIDGSASQKTATRLSNDGNTRRPNID